MCICVRALYILLKREFRFPFMLLSVLWHWSYNLNHSIHKHLLGFFSPEFNKSNVNVLVFRFTKIHGNYVVMFLFFSLILASFIRMIFLFFFFHHRYAPIPNRIILRRYFFLLFDNCRSVQLMHSTSAHIECNLNIFVFQLK